MAITTDQIKAGQLSLSGKEEYTQAFAITKSDTDYLATSQDRPRHTRGLWITGAGTISVIFAEDTDAVVLTVTANTLYRGFAIKKLNSTNTTATGVIGLI